MKEEEDGEICFVPRERSVESRAIARGTCDGAVVVFNDILGSYLCMLSSVGGAMC